MTTSPHTHRIPVQGQTSSVDAILAPVSGVGSADMGTGATPLLPPNHPANTASDSPVVRWTMRLEQARPVEDEL